MNKLLFFDTETTGKDPDDRLVQICYSVPSINTIINSLFRPPVPIKFEAMATHHITQAQADAEIPFADSPFYKNLERLAIDYVFVAHNAKFDVQVLKNEGITVTKYIDTLKVAQNLFPDESMYKLQYLRYKFGLKVPEDARAHDAEGDVLVLEALFEFLYKKLSAEYDVTVAETIYAKMLEISSQPTLLRRMPFGKYKTKTFEELCKEDKKYLDWLSGQKQLSEDLRFTLNHWLKPEAENTKQQALL